MAANPDDFYPDVYGELNPNLVAYYNNNADVQKQYGSLNVFLSEHYRMAGAAEGRPYKKEEQRGSTDVVKSGGTWEDPVTHKTYKKEYPDEFNVAQYAKDNPELWEHWQKDARLREVYGNDFNAWAAGHWLTLPESERKKWWRPAIKEPTDGGGGDGGPGGGGWGEGGGGYQGGSYEEAAWDLLNRRDPDLEATNKQALALTRQKIAYVSQQLTELEEARKLGAATGKLTSDEMALFDEMESSALTLLKDQINEEREDVVDAAIVDLVNRGVLNGSVGQRILGDIGSETLKLVQQGTLAVRSAKDQNILNVMEANKNRFLTREAMLLGQDTPYYQSVVQTDTASKAMGLQALTSFAGLAQQAAEGSANRELQAMLSNASMEQAQRALEQQLKIAQGSWAHSLDIAKLQAASQLAGINAYGSAANQASLYGMGGNIFGGILQTLFGGGKDSPAAGIWDWFKQL